MAAKQSKGPRCEGGGKPGIAGSPPGVSDRCTVCTARPKVQPNGTIKSHEKKSPR